MTQQQLCARTHMDKVTVSRAAAALVGRGLLERRANDADRRSHHLQLTAAGTDLYERIAPKALQLEAEIFGGFDEHELRTMERLLDRVEQAASAAARRQEQGEDK